MSTRRLESDLRALVAGGSLDLPAPGTGSTRRRLETLLEVAVGDLELARLAEAHLDALAIAAEAGHTPRPGALYGVWAAEGPGSELFLDSSSQTLGGSKTFCSGAGIVDRSLVTARRGDERVLLDIDARASRLDYDWSDWKTDAFASTLTARARVDALGVEASDQVGPADFYLERVGFWHGALAPAACWAGGVIGLIDHAVELAHAKPPEPHLDAHVGALTALRWQLTSLTSRAGDEIDSAPDDVVAAVVRARSYRHLVERSAWSALDHVRRALGPRPFISDQFVIERSEQIEVYVLQDHAERDLAALGTVVRHAAADAVGSVR